MNKEVWLMDLVTAQPTAEHAEEDRKQESLERIYQAAAHKRISAVPSWRRKVSIQLRYMEMDSFLAPTWVLAVTLLTVYLMRMELLPEKGMLTAFSVAASFVGVSGIFGIEKVLGYGMGELSATCYYCLSEIVMVRLVIFGVAEGLPILAGCAVVSGMLQEHFLRVLLYILTPFLVSNGVCFGLLIQVRNRSRTFTLIAAALGCSVLWTVFLIWNFWYEAVSLAVWCVVLISGCAVLSGELYLLFRKVRRGEMVCCQLN